MGLSASTQVTCPRSFDLCEQTFPGLEVAAFEVPGSVQVLFFEVRPAHASLSRALVALVKPKSEQEMHNGDGKAAT